MRKFLFVFLLILSFASFAMASSPVARSSTSGKLHVVGTELHDEHGNVVILKGASTHGLTWFPQFVNNGLFRELSKEWNANLIRLAMYSKDYVEGNRQKNLQ